LTDTPTSTDRIKLAAIDLDGTLLGSDHTISAGNRAAVRRAVGAEAIIVLASGRQFDTINAFAVHLGLSPDAPIIAYNGAMIRTHGRKTWFYRPLPAAASSRIVDFCALNGYHLNYYLDDVLYVREDREYGRLYQKRTGTVPLVMGNLSLFEGQCPTKLLLIASTEMTNRLLALFQAEFGDALYITKTEDEYLEFMAPNVSKGQALAETARRLGLMPSQCAAFGDSYNDISMLEWAGLGVAMENARLELKAVAGRIAPSADADGVGAVLDELFPVHPEHE